MLEAMTRNWGAIALRGFIAVLFGVIAIVWPGPTVAVLVILLGAFALVEGVTNIVAGVRGRQAWALAEGIISVVVGIVIVVWPAITALAIPTTTLIMPSARAQACRPRTPATMLVTPSTSAKAPSKITSTATVGPGQTMAITPNNTAINPRRAIAPQLRVIASSMSITSCVDDEGSCRRLPPPEEGTRAYHRKKG